MTTTSEAGHRDGNEGLFAGVRKRLRSPVCLGAPVIWLSVAFSVAYIANPPFGREPVVNLLLAAIGAAVLAQAARFAQAFVEGRVRKARGLEYPRSCLEAPGLTQAMIHLVGPAVLLAVAAMVGIISLQFGWPIGSAIFAGCMWFLLITLIVVPHEFVDIHLGAELGGARGQRSALLRFGILGLDPRAGGVYPLLLAAALVSAGLVWMSREGYWSVLWSDWSWIVALAHVFLIVLVIGAGSILLVYSRRQIRVGSEVRRLRTTVFARRPPDIGSDGDLALMLEALDSAHPFEDADVRSLKLLSMYDQLVAPPVPMRTRFAISFAHLATIILAVAMLFLGELGWKTRFASNLLARSVDGGEAVIEEDGTVAVWDLVGRREMAVLEGPMGVIVDAAFSPDGSRIVIAGRSTISIWESSSGKRLLDVDCDPGDGTKRALFIDIGFSPDGTMIVATTAGGRLRTWDADSGAERAGPVDPAWMNGPGSGRSNVEGLRLLKPTDRWLRDVARILRGGPG